MLKSLILCSATSARFYHIAESGITTDVLGRHLTVETERIKSILKIFNPLKQTKRLHKNGPGPQNHETSAKTELLTIMQGCGFSKTLAQNGSQGKSSSKIQSWTSSHWTLAAF